MGRPALAITTTVALLVFAAPALGGTLPRYDVPPGYAKCPRATAWNGFFKWASVRRTTCSQASRFMRRYGERAEAATDGEMPRSAAGYQCRLRFWRNSEGDVYASRHTCTRGRAVVRFYGMV